jgi:glycolate oxidase FAD binding subunit
MPTITQAAPGSFAEAAQALAAATGDGQTVRLRGAGTKLDWGRPGPDADLELSTAGLDEILEHNAGDHTAILQAGVPLAVAQERFRGAGQRLALDPPLGSEDSATIGGIVATGDSGPLRHRFGAPRDLVLGMTVALSDGTIAKSGGNVIKNVAGYDLAKLFSGSFGTLGLILAVSVRLHPLPDSSTTTLGISSDPDRLAAAAVAMAATPLEFEALDVAWRGGRGGLLARSSGSEHRRRADRAAARLKELGLTEVQVTAEDRELWDRQRAGQRSNRAVLLRLAHRPSRLGEVVRATDAASGTLVGRAALGVSYLALPLETAAGLRAELPGSSAQVLDAPAAFRAAADPWGSLDDGVLALMRRVKERFDPTGTCNPGRFAGGL